MLGVTSKHNHKESYVSTTSCTIIYKQLASITVMVIWMEVSVKYTSELDICTNYKILQLNNNYIQKCNCGDI